MKNYSVIFTSLFYVLCPPSADASDGARLVNLLVPISSMSANFTQSISDEDDNLLERSNGTFKVSRPAKMVWHIEAPLEQQIISNGKLVWLYDPDLDQVIVESADNSLNGSPMSLFAGDLNLIDKIYSIEADISDKKSVFTLTPTESASLFVDIKMIFDIHIPQSIFLRDSFGQQTRIIFNNVALNPSIASSVFNFVPPSDVDIINNVR